MGLTPIRLVDLGVAPAWQTQAVYHALAERMAEDSPDTILLCRPDAPYLCIGYHQVLESVLDPQACQRRGLPIYRRRLGGGATYLDRNQIFYQCVFHHSRMPVMPRDIYAYALAAPVMTLRSLGLEAGLCHTNEVEVRTQRIAGTGGGRIGEAVAVVGNLLLDFDYEAMAAVWQVPQPSFRELALTAMREHMTTLRDCAPGVDAETVRQRLAESFSGAMGRPVYTGALLPEELEAARQAAVEMTSPETLQLYREERGTEPMRQLKISARASIRYDETRLDGREVRGSFWLAGEVIREARLESFPARPWAPVATQLCGVPFAQWKARLA
ncbi:MAG: biotin/lipoate A/B protein ligase family protein [Anaerolineaceae bacterium]|nr:biotin/lipoate A/B protein ligase family protein [Anaerolineaceae bacterium]